MNTLEMSIVVIMPADYAAIRRTVRHLAAQTAKARLELVIVAPAVGGSRVVADDVTGFAGVREIQVSEFSPMSARAAGVRVAAAPVVAFVEEHSFPEPEWAAALIRAHAQPWAVVGPAVLNANPASTISWANLVMEYSQVLGPTPGGVVRDAPAHNSAYKTAFLLNCDDELEAVLGSETIFHWRWSAQGHRIYIEPGARMRHLNYSLLMPSLSLRFHLGRTFAAERRRGWSLFKRMMFVVGAPLIPLIRLGRMARDLNAPGRPRELLPRLAPVLFLLLLVATLGEVFGYAFGAGSSPQRFDEAEFNRERFLNRRDLLAFERET
jgi:hypothetical protein